MDSLKSWGIKIIGVIFLLSIGFQIWSLYQFVNQGARFTAVDGQTLCERIQALERRISGQPPLSCHYAIDKR
jgi:hypothetical protein